MKLIICVDDGYGMAYNKRRQSQDRTLRNKMIELCHHQSLWMNNYSAKQFENGIEEIKTLMQTYQCDIKVDDDFLDYIEDDYCFIEDIKINDHIINKVNEIILVKWNREYPSDLIFNKDYLNHFILNKTEEFTGYSHDLITLEFYSRK